MPYTAAQRRYFHFRAEHPGDGMSKKEARKLAREADKYAKEGREKPPVDKNVDAERADNLINNYPLKKKPKLTKAAPNRRVDNGRLSPHISRYDNKGHKEGGKKAKKQRDAAVRDAINGLLGSVGLPGNALNTTRPIISM
jgi:hypothetical protein